MTTVFTLIDALGWTYLKDREFLPDVIKYRTEVRTVLGFSSGAIPTLLSGLLPRESGHWNLFYYDPDNSPFKWVRKLRFLPHSVLNSRVTRRGIRFVSHRMSRFGGYFQIYGVPTELLPYFDVCEKRDIYQSGGVPFSIFDRLEEMGIPYKTYSYHQLTDAEIIRTACRDLRERRYGFLFVYLCELDAFLHDSCKDERAVEQVIRRYETWLRQLYDEARRADEEIEFFVCSDHGMTPKRSGYDLIGQVKTLGFQMPDDYLALYDSTMARFWFFNDKARESIEKHLSKLDCGHFLSAQEQRQLGVDFSDTRNGELVFLMNPGVLIEPSYFGKLAPQGMHGFHPDDPYSSAVFLANRVPRRPIQTLIDVHDVMMECAEALRGGAYAGR